MTQVDDKFLTIKEVCGVLKISRATYNNYREQPWFPDRVYTVGTRPKYRSSDIAEVPERRARYEASLSAGAGTNSDPESGKRTPAVAPVAARAAPPRVEGAAKVKGKGGAEKPKVTISTEAVSGAANPDVSDKFSQQIAMNRVRDRIRAAQQEMPRPEPVPHVVLRVKDIIVQNASSGKLTMLDQVVDTLGLRNSNPAYQRYVEDALVLVSKSSAEASGLMLGLMVSPENGPHSFLESQTDLAPHLKIDLSTMGLLLDHRRRILKLFEKVATADESAGKRGGKAPGSGS